MRKIRCFSWGVSIVFAIFVIIYSRLYLSFKVERSSQDYIAHAGGNIDGHAYTNSLEAVSNAISKGIKYIELDLALTSDSVLVAAHDWEFFSYITDSASTGGGIPTLEEFKQKKILGKYTPMSYYDIDSIMTCHSDVYIVTDKISSPSIISKWFEKYKNRLLIECFSTEDYNYYLQHGWMPMFSMTLSEREILKQNIKYAFFISSLHYNFLDVYIGDYANHRKVLPYKRAVYSCSNRAKADSLFLKDKDLTLIYIDNVE